MHIVICGLDLWSPAHKINCLTLMFSGICDVREVAKKFLRAQTMCMLEPSIEVDHVKFACALLWIYKQLIILVKCEGFWKVPIQSMIEHSLFILHLLHFIFHAQNTHHREIKVRHLVASFCHGHSMVTTRLTVYGKSFKGENFCGFHSLLLIITNVFP